MVRNSAGLLPYRVVDGHLEVYLVHMSGPYWARKDQGAWSVAKGEYDVGEDPQGVARQEFAEEVGRPAPQGEYVDLGETRLPSGKRVRVFAVATADELGFVESNLFTMEWPPRSGRTAEFPEVDAAAWYRVEEARLKLVPSQAPILGALQRTLAGETEPE